ncbi:MAG: hypothetical protein J2P25_22300, partial [Nocardiopsaceae bacterium]|nr:hypothetical protein [Nocardiopsaceae bacterium]
MAAQNPPDSSGPVSSGPGGLPGPREIGLSSLADNPLAAGGVALVIGGIVYAWALIAVNNGAFGLVAGCGGAALVATAGSVALAAASVR